MNLRGSYIDRWIDRRSTGLFAAETHGCVRTRGIPRDRFASRLSVYKQAVSALLFLASTSLRIPFWSALPSLLLAASSQCFPTDLFLTLSFSFSSCFSFLSSRPRLPVERKKAAGLSVSFLPTIAHYRRDRWDLNPPAVVVVERTWTLHGMGTRARRRCSTRNETPYRWRLVRRSL